MTKTLMIAAALLTLGVGSAFAGDGDVYAQPAQVNTTVLAQQASGQSRLFPTSTRYTTSVYSLFADPGTTQGGEN